VLPSEDARPRRIAATSDGYIWYTDFTRGRLGRLDPRNGEVVDWLSPGGAQSAPMRSPCSATTFGTWRPAPSKTCSCASMRRPKASRNGRSHRAAASCATWSRRMPAGCARLQRRRQNRAGDDFSHGEVRGVKARTPLNQLLVGDRSYSSARVEIRASRSNFSARFWPRRSSARRRRRGVGQREPSCGQAQLRDFGATEARGLRLCCRDRQHRTLCDFPGPRRNRRGAGRSSRFGSRRPLHAVFAGDAVGEGRPRASHGLGSRNCYRR